MAKKKYTQPETIKGGELLGLRVQLCGHIVWPGRFGVIEAQYNDGSVIARCDGNFSSKAKSVEFITCIFDQRNTPIKPS